MISSPTPSVRIGALFPAKATVVTLRGAGDPATLMPEERACTIAFAPKRRNEYAAGRACARVALQANGIEGYPLLTQADRRPRWPAGIVGSITHTTDLCGAVVARTGDIISLGIDVEERGRIEPELWPELFVAEEIERLRMLSSADADVLATLIFSAKESFYKCRFTVTESWLDFCDVAVDVAAADASGIGAYRARLVGADRFARIGAFEGRYAIDPDVVWTGISIEP